MMKMDEEEEQEVKATYVGSINPVQDFNYLLSHSVTTGASIEVTGKKWNDDDNDDINDIDDNDDNDDDNDDNGYNGDSGDNGDNGDNVFIWF